MQSGLERYALLLAIVLAGSSSSSVSGRRVEPAGNVKCYKCFDNGPRDSNRCPQGPVDSTTPGVQVTTGNVGCIKATGVYSSDGTSFVMRFGGKHEDNVVAYNYIRERGGCLDKEGLDVLLEDETRRMFKEITGCTCDTDLCNGD